MNIDYNTYKNIFWHRFQYFLRVRHLSLYRVAQINGVHYQNLRLAKFNRSLPSIPMAIKYSDLLGISLEELCDPRIRVGDVKVEPVHMKEWARDSRSKFMQKDVREFKMLCDKDTDMLETTAENLAENN